MGQLSSKTEQSEVSLRHWITTQQPPSALFLGINTYRSRLIFNAATNQYLQQYNLHFISQQDFTQTKNSYEWRSVTTFKTHKTHKSRQPYKNPQQKLSTALFPEVRHFIDTSSSQKCATSYSCSVYFNKIDVRLKEINDIPFIDSFYLYEVALKGFGRLVQRYGHFNIREDMIFVNKKGEAYVWINSNVSSNVPNLASEDEPQSRDFSNSAVSSRHALTEADMVVQLIKILEINIDKEQQQSQSYLPFSRYLYNSLLKHGNVPNCNQLTHSFAYQQLQKLVIESHRSKNEQYLCGLKLPNFSSALDQFMKYTIENSTNARKSSMKVSSVHDLYELQKHRENQYFVDDEDQFEGLHVIGVNSQRRLLLNGSIQRKQSVNDNKQSVKSNSHNREPEKSDSSSVRNYRIRNSQTSDNNLADIPPQKDSRSSIPFSDAVEKMPNNHYQQSDQQLQSGCVKLAVPRQTADSQLAKHFEKPVYNGFRDNLSFHGRRESPKALTSSNFTKIRSGNVSIQGQNCEQEREMRVNMQHQNFSHRYPGSIPQPNDGMINLQNTTGNIKDDKKNTKITHHQIVSHQSLQSNLYIEHQRLEPNSYVHNQCRPSYGHSQFQQSERYSLYKPSTPITISYARLPATEYTYKSDCNEENKQRVPFHSDYTTHKTNYQIRYNPSQLQHLSTQFKAIPSGKQQTNRNLNCNANLRRMCSQESKPNSDGRLYPAETRIMSSNVSYLHHITTNQHQLYLPHPSHSSVERLVRENITASRMPTNVGNRIEVEKMIRNKKTGQIVLPSKVTGNRGTALTHKKNIENGHFNRDTSPISFGLIPGRLLKPSAVLNGNNSSAIRQNTEGNEIVIKYKMHQEKTIVQSAHKKDRLNYFTTNEQYELDPQIAQDLQKMLEESPNHKYSDSLF